MRLRSLVALVAVASMLSGATLLALEAATRLIDGYPLATARLPAFPPGAWAPRPPVSLAAVAAALGSAPDTDPAWIDQVPPREPHDPDPELLALRDLPRWPQVMECDLYNVWNRAWLDAHGCQENVTVSYLPMPLLAYDPPSGTPRPPYRFRPSRTRPDGLTTNRFAWRGAEVPLDKPRDTIRIAFVGASTTAGAPMVPWAYPDLTVHWLNTWAEKRHPDVRFDLVNAGRPGIGSTDIAAIVRDEVMPMEPDVVVYYEGANQFFRTRLTTAGRDARHSARGYPPATWERLAAPLRPWSALVRRLDALAVVVATRNGREAPKPPYVLDWPPDLDWTAPDIGRPDLPLDLSTILADLDGIRRDTEADGTQLVLTSFVWLAYDGLRLDPIRQATIYQWLNDHSWPYTYADLRRLVDFENTVYRRWAAARGVPFVDVASRFPADPELFLDAIHVSAAGTRVQGWLAFQGLLPLVRERLARGTWPRPDRHPLAAHPGMSEPYEYVLPCAKGPYGPRRTAAP